MIYAFLLLLIIAIIELFYIAYLTDKIELIKQLHNQ